MTEYWMNVYEYPNAGRYYSHSISSKQYALAISAPEYNNKRKTLYRLHIKLKDKPGLLRQYKYTYSYIEYMRELNKGAVG